LTKIVVATSTDPRNQGLIDHVRALGYPCFAGSEQDVLGRYLLAARQARADVIVRVTGDCPLIDATIVDAAIENFLRQDVDYLGNVSPPTYPDGLDTEVFTLQALERAASESSDPFDHEHVTPYLRNSGVFRTGNISNVEDLSALRWTVDEPADFSVVSRVLGHFAPDIHFSWRQVLALQVKRPDLFADNQAIQRNAGAIMGSRQKLWIRAKKII